MTILLRPSKQLRHSTKDQNYWELGAQAVRLGIFDHTDTGVLSTHVSAQLVSAADVHRSQTCGVLNLSSAGSKSVTWSLSIAISAESVLHYNIATWKPLVFLALCCYLTTCSCMFYTPWLCLYDFKVTLGTTESPKSKSCVWKTSIYSPGAMLILCWFLCYCNCCFVVSGVPSVSYAWHFF